MQFSKKSKYVASVCVLASGFVFGQSQDLMDDYGDSFLAYQPLSVPKPKAKQPAPQKQEVAIATEKEKPVKKGVTIQWLRDNYSKLEEKAMDEPTDENMQAHLYTRRILFDKGTRFALKAMEVTNADPILNENSRVPYASLGAQSIRNADYRAQGKAVEHMAKTGGLIVFVDGSCRFCAMQLPILSVMKSYYKMETLVVTIDGTVPKEYKGPFVTDTGLFRRLDLKLTPSIVYLNKPKAYTADDPNVYQIVSQGFYALDELTKQVAYAGFKSNLLTAEINKDLDVWTRGVLATSDINALELDASDPSSFKKQIAPILLKSLKE